VPKELIPEVEHPVGAPAPKDPLGITRAIIAELAGMADITMDTWKAEVRQVALAAAAHGDFKSALKGYEDLGKHLGTLTDAPAAQHLHLHSQEAIRESSTEDLQQRLAQIKASQAELNKPQSDAPSVDDEIEDLLA
jgi:hypothetical protein